MKRMRLTLIVACVLFAGTVTGQSPPSSIRDPDPPPPADNFKPVARVFGRDIFMTELNPTDDELGMHKRMQQKFPRPGLSEDEFISATRRNKLAHLIWEPIQAEFDRTHDVKPTETEIDDHIRAFDALKAAKPLPPSDARQKFDEA